MTRLRGEHVYDVARLRAKIAKAVGLKSVSLAFCSQTLRAHSVPGSVAGLREWLDETPPTPAVLERLLAFEKELDEKTVKLSPPRPRGRPSYNTSSRTPRVVPPLTDAEIKNPGTYRNPEKLAVALDEMREADLLSVLKSMASKEDLIRVSRFFAVTADLRATVVGAKLLAAMPKKNLFKFIKDNATKDELKRAMLWLVTGA